MVVHEGVAGCFLRPEAVEREVQDRCAHLVSEPVAAMIRRQPENVVTDLKVEKLTPTKSCIPTD